MGLVAIKKETGISAGTDDSMAGNLPDSPLKVAVVGNPNVGKSTLINALAGARLQVGNWPGVTVEKKEALFEYGSRRVRFVDLPGAYSLSPYTLEEIITRNYLTEENPDLIVNVVDATNLERNLYMTVQLLELGIPVVMALNMFDDAQSKGYRIDTFRLAQSLGVRVVPTAAVKKQGLTELLDQVVADPDKKSTGRFSRLNYGEDIEEVIAKVSQKLLSLRPQLAETYPLRWLACKLIENDKHLVEKVDIEDPESFLGEYLEHLRRAHDEDVEGQFADARHAIAAGVAREVLQKPAVRRMEITEKIDRIVLNRYLGLPLFLLSMWLIFKLTFDISTPFGDWLDGVISGPLRHWIQAGLEAGGLPPWFRSLVIEGILSGVGFVLVFVPVIFVMMFFITLLEASGYLARAAFVMDRAMQGFGLHGKSFIPMLLGFGCNVPAVYATRSLDNERDKVLTALLIPLMSCGARLPVYVLFAGVFFSAHAGTVIWMLYVSGIALAIVMGILFKNSIFRGERPTFIMELPPYRMPSLRNLAIHTWEKGKHFLFKAGTYILAVSVFVWFMLNLPWGVAEQKDSYLGQAGQFLAPVFAPVGFGSWEAASALLTGVVAKEVVIGTMGEIYGPGLSREEEPDPLPLREELVDIVTSLGNAGFESVRNVMTTFGVSSLAVEDVEEGSPLRRSVLQAFSPLSALSFMVFVLLYVPCVVVTIAMRQEFGSWKWPALAFGYQTVLAWGVAFVIYQGGVLFGLGGG